MKLTIDNITDNPKILKLLESKDQTDIAVGLELLNKDPNTDFKYKLFLFTEVPAGAVNILYNTSYKAEPDYERQSQQERCKIWILDPK